MATCNLDNDKIFIKLLELDILKVSDNGKILNTKTGNFTGENYEP